MHPSPGIYGWSPGAGGVHYHRVAEPLRAAALHDNPCATGNIMSDEILERFDTILVHMLWDERNSEAWQKIAANGTHRMIFDIDDAMWTPDRADVFKKTYTREVLHRIYDNVRAAHVITTPSPYIAEKMTIFNRNAVS